MYKGRQFYMIDIYKDEFDHDDLKIVPVYPVVFDSPHVKEAVYDAIRKENLPNNEMEENSSVIVTQSTAQRQAGENMTKVQIK